MGMGGCLFIEDSIFPAWVRLFGGIPKGVRQGPALWTLPVYFGRT